MGKKIARRSAKRQRHFSNPAFDPNLEREKPTAVNHNPLQAQTEAQGHYILSIQSNIITFGIGPAGTGKTYIAATMAADALLNGDVSKIVVTRPACEAGESLGHLPGEISEKFEPYFAPVRAVLDRRLGKSHVESLLRSKRIEVMPLAYMRGATFDDSFVILDEAQNTTPGQMKLFLTRIGEYSKVVVDGDIDQTDLKGENGLSDAMRRMTGVKGVGRVDFTTDDIVRSGIAREVVLAYSRA